MAIKDNMRKLEKLDSPIDIGDFTIDFGNINKKKVVFMGTPQFAVPILEMLIENYDVVLVVCQPDKEKDRKGFISDSSEVFNKLYTPNTEKYQKYQKIKEIKDKEKEEKELKACTFKPKLISQTSYKKSLQSTEKPKGYEEFSQKMREGILKAAEKRYKENKYIKFLIF